MKNFVLLTLLICSSYISYATNSLNTEKNSEFFKTTNSNLNGANSALSSAFDSLQFSGEDIENYFGNPVTSAGDVNGDGYSDVMVSASNYNFGVGRVYIYFGGPLMDNIADVILTGQTANSFGYSISTAGDVNGDGFSDVIIGAPDISMSTFVTRAYIFYGGSSMNNVPDVIILNNNTMVFSLSVSTAGDVNGDGFSDVIVSSSIEGLAYIYFGGSTMNNIADVVLMDKGNINFGRPVATAGDVNGDGFSDVIVGEYIFFGGAPMDNIADVILPIQTFSNHSDLNNLGNGNSSISSAGDVNGDGYSDIITGDFRYNITFGRAYIYFGGSPMNNTVDLILNSEGANTYFGNSVSSAGDINGDGFSDVIVGCNNYNNRKGKVYIYFGDSNMNNISDLIYNGEEINSDFGACVSCAGDINGDGFSDVIIGASNYDLGTGKAFVYSNLLLKPELISPVNNSTNNPVNINFKWKKINLTSYYNLIVATDSAFTNVIVNDSITNDTSKTISGFQIDTKYYWKIRAVNSSGYTYNSTIWNFRTVPPLNLNIKVIFEGMYFPIFNLMTRKDTLSVYLRETFTPYNVVDTSKSVIDSISFTGLFKFYNTKPGTYYIVTDHINCLDTWSKFGGKEFTNDSLNYNYDFSSLVTQAYGNNLKLKGSKYCLISGDVIQDGFIDISDFTEIDNGTFIFQSGRFIPADLNGDNIVDLNDMQIVENNRNGAVISP